MPASSFVKNQNDGSVTLKANGGTPSITLAFDSGDFSATGIKRKLQDTNAYQRRGALTTVRHTTRNFPTISFTAQFTNFEGNEGGGSNGNPLEAALGDGGTWGSANSTLGANADVYTLDVEFVVEGSDFGDSGDHDVTFHDVELSWDISEGDPTTVSFSGTVYGEIDGDVETLLPT
jgi:hypothetical protein